MIETPELDKQREIISSGAAGTVQNFIDWLLDEQHVTLAVYEERPTTRRCQADTQASEPDQRSQMDMEQYLSGSRKFERRCNEGEIYYSQAPHPLGPVLCIKCRGTGEVLSTLRTDWWPLYRPRERLMADFFGIDLDKIEQERRAILDFLRERAS